MTLLPGIFIFEPEYSMQLDICSIVLYMAYLPSDFRVT